MLKRLITRGGGTRDVRFDERTGVVRTPACRVAAQRDRQLTRALLARGPR
jgi:hypothetical protein